jgi:hypothetical protein
MKKFGEKSLVCSGEENTKFLPINKTKKVLDWYSISFYVGVSKKNKKKFRKEVEKLYFDINKTVTTIKEVEEYLVKEVKK